MRAAAPAGKLPQRTPRSRAELQLVAHGGNSRAADSGPGRVLLLADTELSPDDLAGDVLLRLRPHPIHSAAVVLVLGRRRLIVRVEQGSRAWYELHVTRLARDHASAARPATLAPAGGVHPV